jgi:hypothetical protein
MEDKMLAVDFENFIKKHQIDPDEWLALIAFVMDPSNGYNKSWEQVMSSVELAVKNCNPSDVSSIISGLNVQRYAMEQIGSGLWGKSMRKKAEVLSALLQVMAGAARGEYKYFGKY